MYIYVYIYIHILAAAQRRAVLEHQVHHLRVVHGERPHAAEGIQEQQAAHAHHEHTLQRERERWLVCAKSRNTDEGPEQRSNTGVSCVNILSMFIFVCSFSASSANRQR